MAKSVLKIFPGDGSSCFVFRIFSLSSFLNNFIINSEQPVLNALI
uniref:Uncharacterized protein n=1 Tax=viral metagenome TaxID=1070528 RepID=A0A6C0HMK9_9ZZZZ